MLPVQGEGREWSVDEDYCRNVPPPYVPLSLSSSPFPLPPSPFPLPLPFLPFSLFFSLFLLSISLSPSIPPPPPPPPRYIFTMLSPLARLIFPPPDDHQLTHLHEDNMQIVVLPHPTSCTGQWQ